MCDYDSDHSDVGLYDIPEFPGYDQLQVGYESEPDTRASVEGAEQYSSETGADSNDDVLFILSRPVQAALQPDIPVVNDTAHEVQVPSHHVTNFGQQNLTEIFRTIAEPSEVLNRSVKAPREETNAQRQQRLLQRILANPHQRKERAKALGQLQREAEKLNFVSGQAPFKISELQQLAQQLASKTESTASELVAQYIHQARKRHARSVVKAQGGGSGSRASENVSQSPSINSGGAQESRTAAVKSVLVKGGKPLIRKASRIQNSLLRLHNAVNSGTTIAQPQYKTVRAQIMQLARALEINQEVEIAKFDLLYHQRSDIPR
jgi:hypothetical protein